MAAGAGAGISDLRFQIYDWFLTFGFGAAATISVSQRLKTKDVSHLNLKSETLNLKYLLPLPLSHSQDHNPRDSLQVWTNLDQVEFAITNQFTYCFTLIESNFQEHITIFP